MTRIRLNAFDKDSSASYSKTVGSESTITLLAEIRLFEEEVPFSRFYRDDEVLNCPSTESLEVWQKFLDEN